MSINFDGALTLLKVADLAKQWPALQSLHDAAMEQLTALSQRCVVEREQAKERARQEAARQEAMKAKEMEDAAAAELKKAADEKAAAEQKVKDAAARVAAEAAAAERAAAEKARATQVSQDAGKTESQAKAASAQEVDRRAE